MSVWITRSAPDNLRTARELHALGQRPLMVPVITTVARYQPPITSLPDAIVFTSVHAVRHFARRDQLASVPVFAASGSVANAASLAGYGTVTSTGNDDEMLSDLIGHVLPPAARILLLCGDSTSPIVADRLAARDCRVARQPVYKSVPVQDHALVPVTGAMDRISAIVLHSRSGAERIVPMLRGARWRGALWCISEQAARACSELQHVSVHTATHPTEGSLLDMIARISPAGQKRPSQPRRRNAAILTSALQSRRSSRGLAARNDNVPDVSPDDHPDPTAA
ncbi:uroporphyrinogen-III synthase [Sphingomonas aliaeris]|uniref:Uroporphyrinogen-III synthase n=1 Tax=Sphingomonas aliaeris TaxID=2759526 RepID=A0A974NW28_9SPHN|nr:uroporphyrinogen-III synthase [Sphingomonas aliaeris]QQV77985.1 uroporphyrinogen-III synthase [Sphingomonas aliaeris]